ncbi:hypothetical protein MBLNU230_g4845t1 [Neophaeotheca triangularis]
MPVYCITGANRGLGLELVRQLSTNTDNTILACVRSSTTDLTDLKAATSPTNKTVHILECDITNRSSIQDLATQAQNLLPADSKITHLLANAGVNSVPHQNSLDLQASDMHHEIDVNVLGPQQITSILLAAGLLAQDVRIMNTTSGLGSMKLSLSISPRKCATYSLSKAALNMLTVHQSGDVRDKGGLQGAVVVCMDPGWVRTRMGGEAAALSPEESVGGILKCLHGLREADNGKFFTYTGEEMGW